MVNNNNRNNRSVPEQGYLEQPYGYGYGYNPYCQYQPNVMPLPQPLTMANGAAPIPPQTVTNNTTPYQNANTTSHFVTGVVAGAALAYLLTNKKFQQNIGATVQNLWGSMRGEVEELKERLADAQAELDYYHQQDSN